MFNNIYSDKKILVTGHTGFKGSWLCLWLKSLGAEVAGFSAYVPSKPAHFDFLQEDAYDLSIEGDVRDFELLKKEIDNFCPDIVFHLAANPIVSDCYKDPRMAFEVNLMGTVNVLEAVKDSKSVKSVVMITSDKCYENVEWYYGYREGDKLGGIDPYSASKACAEIAISSLQRSFLKEKGIRVCSARAGNVIGGGDWAANRIIPDIVKKWYSSEELSIRSPNSTRPWQHVLEPLSGYLQLGAILDEDIKSLEGEAFNFGPRENLDISVLEVVKSMSKYINGSWKVEADASFKKEAGLLKLNCDKANFLLDWQASLNYEETIRFTAQWYKEFYEGNRDSICEFSKNQIKEYCLIAKKKNTSWSLDD